MIILKVKDGILLDNKIIDAIYNAYEDAKKKGMFIVPNGFDVFIDNNQQGIAIDVDKQGE